MGGESGKSEDESRAARAFLLPAILGVIAFATLVIFAAGMRSGQEQVCTTPTYEPDGRRWEELPPANIDQSIEGCVGFCFNAVVDGKQSEGVDRVVVLEGDGMLTRGVVERPDVSGIEDFTPEQPTPLRFACFWSRSEADGTPRYESCAEMAVIEPSAPGCEQEPALVSQVLRAFGFGGAGEASPATRVTVR